jgi:uncharacterized protein YeaO (DUF488 family)
MTGTVTETYAAAIQHDLVDLDGVTTVGVVRRPAGWFHAQVEENHRELGPPDGLLAETKELEEEFELRGMCSEGAVNAAWEEADFADRYRSYLDDSADARAAIDSIAERVRGGEAIALVCYEGDDKRCHRHILLERVRGRV